MYQVADGYLIFFVDFVFILLAGWSFEYASDLNILSVGFLGVIVSQNHLITLLMFMELILVAIAFFFTLTAVSFGGPGGFFFTYLLLVVAGVESALALSVITNYFFVENRIYGDQVMKLKG